VVVVVVVVVVVLSVYMEIQRYHDFGLKGAAYMMIKT